jgi:hypothetical protein
MRRRLKSLESYPDVVDVGANSRFFSVSVRAKGALRRNAVLRQNLLKLVHQRMPLRGVTTLAIISVNVYDANHSTRATNPDDVAIGCDRILIFSHRVGFS